MRKFAILITSLLLTASLSASPIVYGLDSSFDIPFLVNNNFKIEILEEDDNHMEVTPPPQTKLRAQDSQIESFHIYPVKSNSNDWDSTTIMFQEEVPYSAVYDYVKANYGEGLSKEDTLFYIIKHHSEPSEENKFSKYIEGEIGSYLGDYYIARALKTYIDNEPVLNLNMWKTDDVVVFTFQNSGLNSGIFFVNYDTLKTQIEKLYSALYDILS